MKLRFKPMVAAGASAATIGGVLLASLGPAFAATTPPWEPDPNSASPYGNVVFYDANGHVVTGGSNLSHFADWAAATTPGDPARDGGTGAKATLYFYTPKPNTATGSFPGGVTEGGSSAYPNSTAPAPLNQAGFNNPLAKISSTQGSVTNYLASNPTDTTAGYQNIIQVRMLDTGPNGGSSPSYWSTDIQVDPVAGTWTVVYPTIAATSTSISTTPANGATANDGTPVQINATVTGGQPGTVTFYRNGTAIGTSAVSGGTASFTDNSPVNDAANAYTAWFDPNPGTEVASSQSNTSTVTEAAPAPATSTTLSINPASTPQFGPATFTATVTGPNAASETGSVVFKAVGPDPSTSSNTLGTVSSGTANGSAMNYVLNVSQVTLSTGNYKVTAYYTATDPTSGAASDSGVPAQDNFAVTAPTCKGTPVPGQSCTDTQNIDVTVTPGSLTITTPYNGSNVFHLPAMQLSPDAKRLQTAAQFPKAGDPDITVQSSLAGDPNWTVSVAGTDLSDGSGHSIDGKGLGLTAGALDPSPSFPGTVTFTANPAHDPSSSDTNVGIKGGPFTFAQSSNGGNGTANMHGTLTLYAPTSTLAGTYSGTITFSVA